MNIRVEITGDKAIQAKLHKLVQVGEGRIVRKALYAGGLVIEGEAKVNIQKVNAIATGFMMNSVYTTTQDKSDYGAINTPSQREGHLLPAENPGAMEAIVAVGADYGIYVEFPTSRQPTGRPFLRPAADSHGSKVAQAIGAVLKDEIGGA